MLFSSNQENIKPQILFNNADVVFVEINSWVLRFLRTEMALSHSKYITKHIWSTVYAT